MKDYVLTLLVAAAVTYILTPLVRRLASRVGALKKPRERDVHVVPVPTLGGLAMYGGLAAALLVAGQIPQLAAGFAHTGIVSGLLLAGGLLVVIGFIDDRWGMGVLPKAAGQVAAAGILVATGTTLNWVPLPGGSTYIPTTDQATLLTILIVVATINAVNFIDGLDGLAAGIVCIAAISFFIYYYTLTNVINISSLAAPALASAILIGICLGFLPHNFSPATIFMGDTGSMLLGLLLAYAPISSISSLDPAELGHQINRYPEIMPLILPAALLVIPYGDLLLAVVRRTRAGRSPFAPDRKHLHHRLLDIGHSQRASVVIMYLWAAVFSGSVVWLSVQKTDRPRAPGHHGQPVFVFIIITAAAVIALLLMSMPRLRWWQRPRLAAQAGTAAAAGLGHGAAAELAAPAEPEPGLVALSASNGAHAGATGTAMTSQPRPPVAPVAAPAAVPLAAPPGRTGDGTGGTDAGQPLNGRPPAGPDSTFPLDRGGARPPESGWQHDASASAARQAPASAELPRWRDDRVAPGWQVRGAGEHARQADADAGQLARNEHARDDEHARNNLQAGDDQHVHEDQQAAAGDPAAPASFAGSPEQPPGHGAAPSPSRSVIGTPPPAVTQVPVHPVPRRGPASGRRSFPGDRGAP